MTTRTSRSDGAARGIPSDCDLVENPLVKIRVGQVLPLPELSGDGQDLIPLLRRDPDVEHLRLPDDFSVLLGDRKKQPEAPRSLSTTILQR